MTTAATVTGTIAQFTTQLDLTIAGFGTPAGVLIWGGPTSLNSLEAKGKMSFGYWVNGGSQGSMGIAMQDAAASANTSRSVSYEGCISCPVYNGDNEEFVYSASGITDGIRLTEVSSSNSGARSVFAIFFKNCDVAGGNRSATTGTQTINLGFRPNFVASAQNDLVYNGSGSASTTHGSITIGYASANFQAGTSTYSQDFLATTQSFSATRFLGPALATYASTSRRHSTHIENFTDTSFDFRSVDGAIATRGAHIWFAIGSGGAASDATLGTGVSVASTLTNTSLGDNNGVPTAMVLGVSSYLDNASEGNLTGADVYGWGTWWQGPSDTNPTLYWVNDEDGQSVTDTSCAIFDNGTIPLYNDGGISVGNGALACGDGTTASSVGVNITSAGMRFFGIAIKGSSGVRQVSLGSDPLSEIYIGSSTMSAVYVGDTLVWS